MTSLAAFDVDIVPPQEGVRTYDLGPDFFGLFEHSLLEEGKLTAQVSMHLSSRLLEIFVKIQGTVQLVCDRSLKPFDYPVQLEKKVTFKRGHEYQEIGTDMYMIEQHVATINIAQHLYDFVSLAIPMKKIHPQFETRRDPT